MDFDTWVLIEEGMLDQKERDHAKEEECFTCGFFPCGCDRIYDEWKDSRYDRYD